MNSVGGSTGAALSAASQVPLPISNTADFAQTLGMSIEAGEPRGTHRRAKGKYKTRVRMPSKLDPYLVTIEGWLAAEPQLTALAIVGRLAQRDADQFGPKQHSIVQRLLKALRRKAAERLIAATTTSAADVQKSDAGGGKTAVGLRPPSVLPPSANRDVPCQSINARRTTASVTFLREAIRGVNFRRRLTS